MSAEPSTTFAATDDNDILCVLQGWLDRTPEENLSTIAFEEVDTRLKLPPGSAARLLETAATKLHYVADQKGPKFIRFRKCPLGHRCPRVLKSGLEGRSPQPLPPQKVTFEGKWTFNRKDNPKIVICPV